MKRTRIQRQQKPASATTNIPRQVGKYTWRQRTNPKKRAGRSIGNNGGLISQNAADSKQIRVGLDFWRRDTHIGAA
jgi:hypothetical protein